MRQKQGRTPSHFQLLMYPKTFGWPHRPEMLQGVNVLLQAQPDNNPSLATHATTMMKYVPMPSALNGFQLPGIHAVIPHVHGTKVVIIISLLLDLEHTT